MTAGAKLVALYLIAFYVVPAVGNTVFADEISTIYKTLPLSWKAPVVMLLVAVLATVFSIPRFAPLPAIIRAGGRRICAATIETYDRWRLWFAVASVALSLSFYRSGLNAYRYANVEITSGDAALTILVATINVIITVDMFRRMFLESHVSTVFNRRRVEDLLLSVSLVMSANGSASVLTALATLVFAIAPAAFGRMIYALHSSPMWKRAMKTTATLAIGGTLFVSAWLAGETIKASSQPETAAWTVAADVTERLVSETTVDSYIYYLVASLSSQYYATLFVTATPYAELTSGIRTPGVLPFETLLFRVDYLLGQQFGVKRPDIGSLSRWNYLLLTEDPNSSRAGTSPGVLASFIYVFGLLIGVPACAFYLAWVGRLVDGLVREDPERKLSGVGLMLLMLFVLALFQSPFDLMMVIDNASLQLGLMLCVYLARSATAAPAPDANVARAKRSARCGAGVATGVSVRPWRPRMARTYAVGRRFW